MGISLGPHQRTALLQMKNGCVLCGGVGSGKSRTAIAYYTLENGGDPCADEYCPMEDPPKDLYIITTARKRDTMEWEGELSPFLLSTSTDINLYSNKVVIDSWNNLKKYVNVQDAFFIFDEQRVIGKGVWTKSFLKIVKKNRWILLSATPGDTWGDYIPVFIANGFYKNRTEFNYEHVVFSRFMNFPKISHYLNEKKLRRLRDQILVDMDFERETVPHHEVLYSDFDASLYKEVGKNRWDPYKNEPIINASGLCYLWRKICNIDEGRQQLLLDISKVHPRIIVFYNYDYELDILRNLDYGPDVCVAEWNGHKHEPIPETQRWVYLVQYAAGAEGWNCIDTNVIVFYSQNYSYKTMVQASGRIDRLNTTFKDLFYYHFKSRAPIDLAISRALKAKKNFNERNFIKGL